MYLAKDQGRNNFQFFKPELTNAAQDRLALENELRKALPENELQLHYQPQFDTATGEIIGVEALVRWHHPRRGWISPAQFIPIAEQSGLIETLGAWVLRTACAQNMQWQRHGYSPIRMAVNVSARQFQQKGFIDIVDRVLEETGLDPRWLELEVTENIVMENVSQTIMTLTALKARSISLAIDDFGTGYSSLSYLRQFPIDRLKIDRSFVAEVITNADDAAIASAVISLARTLNLEVVAEGVETAEQARFLTERQCDIMQGYYFGRPSPPDEISRFLERRCQASACA
jgi:EAL domain-containing protein (putative c-di-GMP-specific phosphodiesterase class I)